MMHLPEISLPELPEDFPGKAAETLRQCCKAPLPDKGFPNPYIAPGGAYGTMWWQLDFSIALGGMRFLDPSFCRESLLNFVTAQKEDGRIPLWGNDRLPEYNGERLQREGVSSLPKLFDAAWKIAQGTDEKEYLYQIFTLLLNYLNWFRKARYDEKSALMSAVFEETFLPYLGFAGEYAPVDLNIEVLHGLYCTSSLAGFLGEKEYERALFQQAEELKMAIREGLWNEEKGSFSAKRLQSGAFFPKEMASTFAALRRGVATERQKEKLLKKLLDPKHFNWGKRPLSSVDMTDRSFAAITAKQHFGNPCWNGNVWTLTNENAVRGLLDCGEKALAGELAAKTLELFYPTFCEFLNPLTGDPCGVLNYAWSAGACVDMIFSVLFGLTFDAWQKEIRLEPALPESWKNREISFKGLLLPNGDLISVKILCSGEPEISAEIKCSNGNIEKYKGKKRILIPFPERMQTKK